MLILYTNEFEYVFTVTKFYTCSNIYDFYLCLKSQEILEYVFIIVLKVN